MKYFRQQRFLHPSMQPQDVAKLCYQATYGAEHLLTDAQSAKDWLLHEFEKTPPREEPLFENISDRYCRVNLGAWKAHGLTADSLFIMFYQTASTKTNASMQTFETCLQEITSMAEDGLLPFSVEEWLSFLSSYNRQALHHSDVYRTAEMPAYRVVLRELLDLSALCR